MKREVCKPVISLVEQGELDLPWFDSKQLAEQALEFVMRVAQMFELEVIAPKVVCVIAYLA